MSRLANELVFAFKSRYPIIWIVSSDEERVEDVLKDLAIRLWQTPRKIRVWTCVSGFEHTEDTKNPDSALAWIEKAADADIYLLKDFPDWLINNPALQRHLKNLYYHLRKKNTFLVLLTPNIPVPQTLSREVYMIPFDIPDESEITEFLHRFPFNESLKKFIPEMAHAMRGLTFNEIFHLVQRLAQTKKLTPESVLNIIFQEKEQIIRKEGVLEYVPPRWSIEDIGGLDMLKDWLRKRAKLFTPEARKKGLPAPKGILIMGISGCGKSLAVKAVSSLWKLPLYRLDMNLVLSGGQGNPEWVFHRALKLVEAVSPAILWFDEIEMGVGRYHETGGEGRSHIFSTFLTWMQERQGDVFIAATANRIHLLPAELLRKGRFDQIFYVDLPSDEERKEIFRIHLRKQQQDPALFDLVGLAAMTKGWTGAEIEQAVINARIEALHEGKPMSMDHLIMAIGQIVPLSKTMEDQIKAIKTWAYDRAMPASSSSRRYR